MNNFLKGLRSVELDIKKEKIRIQQEKYIDDAFEKMMSMKMEEWTGRIVELNDHARAARI